MNAHPAYASYLPAAYLADPGGLLDRLVQMFETLMAGGGDEAVHRVRLESLDPAVRLAIESTVARADYDAGESRLSYLGEMSRVDRAALDAAVTAGGLSVGEDRRHRDAIAELARRSQWRPLRSLVSWLQIENLDAGVRLAIESTVARAVYDSAASRLSYLGEMSAVDRAALDAAVSAAALSPDEDRRHRDAMAELERRSLGREEPVPGLEGLLDSIARYSDPIEAPGASRNPTEGELGYFDDDFVPYLAQWVALGLRQHWPDAKRRRLIRSIVPLYKKRGTPDGIRQVLELFVEWPVQITEDLGLVIGERSTVAQDTTVGGTPHFFRVHIPFGHREPGTPPEPFETDLLRSVVGFTYDVVDQEKPAHTDYNAEIDFPGFIIGDYSTVAYDTLITPDQPIVLHGSERN